MEKTINGKDFRKLLEIKGKKKTLSLLVTTKNRTNW